MRSLAAGGGPALWPVTLTTNRTAGMDNRTWDPQAICGRISTPLDWLTGLTEGRSGVPRAHDNPDQHAPADECQGPRRYGEGRHCAR